MNLSIQRGTSLEFQLYKRDTTDRYFEPGVSYSSNVGSIAVGKKQINIGLVLNQQNKRYPINLILTKGEEGIKEAYLTIQENKPWLNSMVISLELSNPSYPGSAFAVPLTKTINLGEINNFEKNSKHEQVLYFKKGKVIIRPQSYMVKLMQFFSNLNQKIRGII